MESYNDLHSYVTQTKAPVSYQQSLADNSLHFDKFDASIESLEAELDKLQKKAKKYRNKREKQPSDG